MSHMWAAALTLFLILDPFGNIPVYLSELKKVRPERQKRVVWRELLIALCLLLTFLWGGPAVLDVFGLSQEAVGLGGGIILFIIAMKMIFPGPPRHHADEDDDEPFIVPLAIPMMAGPSALATLLIMRRTMGSHMLELTAAVVLAWAMSALILSQSIRLYDLLGRRGLRATERLMGMLLITISVQMLIDGVRGAFFPGA